MSKGRKVLFCCPLPPPVHGQAYVSQLAFQGYEGPKLVISQNYENKPKIIRALLTLAFFAKFLFKLGWYNPTTIYFTCSRTVLGAIKDLWLLFWGGYIFRKTIIVHLHGSDFRSFYNSAPSAYRVLLSWLYKYVSTAIVLTNEMQEQFQMFPKLKINVLPNFYDPILDKATDRYPDTSVTVASAKILFFSNVMYSKGVFQLLDAFLKLTEKYPEIECHLAGKIAGDSHLSAFEVDEKFKTYLHHQKIVYHGLVSASTKAKFLNGGDIFVLPSFYRSEAFPVSFIEALRAGNYVITTAVGYHAATVDKVVGRVIENHEVDTILEAIDFCLTNPELIVQAKSRNREFAVANFSYAAFKQGFHAIISGAGN